MCISIQIRENAFKSLKNVLKYTLQTTLIKDLVFHFPRANDELGRSAVCPGSVSYTHLDVYKRQVHYTKNY